RLPLSLRSDRIEIPCIDEFEVGNPFARNDVVDGVIADAPLSRHVRPAERDRCEHRGHDQELSHGLRYTLPAALTSAWLLHERSLDERLPPLRGGEDLRHASPRVFDAGAVACHPFRVAERPISSARWA